MYLTIKHFILFVFFIVCFKISIGQNQTKKVKEYYENGILKTKGKLKNDLKTGIWFYYNDIGALIQKEYWKKGKLNFTIKINEKHKAYEILYPNGNVKKLRTCGC